MKSYLIDTHYLLWILEEHPRAVEKNDIWLDPSHTIYVSMASLWEIAIKVSSGKLSFPGDFQAVIEETGFEILPIHFSHLQQLLNLPHHHKDPFDRLIIAQAQVENIPIISVDPVFKEYPVDVL